MARYAPIAPVKLLHKMQEQKILGNYQLYLTHNVLDNLVQYERLTNQIRANRRGVPFIIMDNGVIENGEPSPVEQTIAAAKIVNADCIVLPDELESFAGTRGLIENQMMQIHSTLIPWMRVPQGKDMAEIVQCIEWIHLNVHVPSNYWGIPRWFTNKLEAKSRIPAIQYINALVGDPKIHLLGMSENLEDDLRCCKLPGVIGIDSANPIVLGLKGRRLGSTHRYEHPPRTDLWWAEELTPEAIANIQFMHDNVAQA